MPPWCSEVTTLLWHNSLTILPLVALVAVICKWLPCRPSTRHMLWLIALISLLTPPLISSKRVTRLARRILPAAVDASPSSGPVARGDESTKIHSSMRPDSSPRLVTPVGQKQKAPSMLLVTPEKPSRLPSAPAMEAPEYRVMPPVGSPLRGQRPSLRTTPKAAEAAARQSAVQPDYDASPALLWIPSRVHVPGPAQVLPLALPEVRVQTIIESPVSVQRTVAYSQPVRSDAHPWRQQQRVLERKWAEFRARLFGALAAQIPACLESATQLRSAVFNFPQMPALPWLAGVVCLLGIGITRMLSFGRVLRDARPAPAEVVTQVRRVARSMGIKRIPSTYMVTSNVSPLVMCGRHVRLVLPRTLWAQLDPVGRHAVICHELAHLKRKDHWICWFDWLIGVVYWWNPIVWWARKQLQEEAELSCDQWVTYLFPKGRRAYAEALLISRRQLSRPQPAASALAFGTSSQRQNKLSRRIRMIMTDNAKPRLSATGLTLACALALAGWIAGPVWACPPEEKKAKNKQAKTTRVITVPATAPHDEGGSTYEEHLRDKQRSDTDAPECDEHEAHAPTAPLVQDAVVIGASFGGDDEQQELRERIERLEWRLQRLTELLEQRGLSGPMEPMPRADREPRPPVAPMPAPRVPEGERISRMYHLPEGKLQALTELMVRDDVPVLVTPHDDGIEVHASPAQHEVFGAFVEAIAGSNETMERDYRLSQGKLEALSKLMVRGDVPILVSVYDDHIQVHGNSMVQNVFGRFVELIESGRVVGIGGGEGARAEQLAREELFRAQAIEAAARREAEQKARQMRTHARDLEQRARELERESEAIQRQAERLERQAERVEQKAEKRKGEMREEVHRQADELRQQADALRDQADAIQDEADNVRDQLEDLSDSFESS